MAIFFRQSFNLSILIFSEFLFNILVKQRLTIVRYDIKMLKRNLSLIIEIYP